MLLNVSIVLVRKINRLFLNVGGRNRKYITKVLPDELQYFLIEVDVKASGCRMLDDQCGRESISG